MKIWAKLVLFCVVLAAPAAAETAPIPLDDSGFTAYIQQKLQLYSAAPIQVAGPFKVRIVLQYGNSIGLEFPDIHAACLRAPANCEAVTHAYVQDTVRTVLAPANAPGSSQTASGAVPSGKSDFMAYAAAKLAKLMPDAKIEIDGLRLNVTRPGGRAVPLDAAGSYKTCAAQNFKCEAAMDELLATLRDWLVVPDRGGLRASLHIMASCNVVASVGNTVSCTIRPSPEPLSPFFRRAFANLEEVCFKTLSNGAVIPVTNADRKDMGLDIGDALNLCAAATHDALGPLAAKLKALPAGGIGSIDEVYAASYALFAADWSGFAAASGGHMLVAVPSRDTLLYMTGDGEADIAALGARARAAFFANGLAISTDVYRWTGDGWTLATARSTMAGGPLQSTDLMPHAPH